MKNIITKIAKNGVKMYFLDGKRISRDKAIEISENADNEMLTNALGANIEFKDAQAILVISTVDPLEGDKDREFGWCFTNVVDAVEAAKKVAAPFGNRFIKAYIMGDAEHFDNRIITTVDKAGNVKVSEEIADKTVTFYPTATPKPCSGKLFGYDYCEYHSVDEYISELKITQIAVIMENLFKNEDGSFSYDGWGRKTYYMTDCYREAYYGGGITDEIKFDAESTAQLIYAEQQLKNIVNGSDGSEEDIDGDNVFDYLPALDELNDVDIDDDDNTPPDNEPMSDDISDICKYNPDLEDDDKSCRLDWDDSAIAHIPTDEEELAAFINPQFAIEEEYLEPVIIDNGKTYTEAEYFAKTAPDKIAAAKPKHSRRQLRDLIDSNLAEINYYLDGLDECSADENCPQSHIDFLHDKIKNLGKKYRQYYREYRDTHAEEIAG